MRTTNRLYVAAALWLLAVGTVGAQSVTSAIPTPATDMTLAGPYKAGRFYTSMTNGNVAGAALGAANTLYASPFFVVAPSQLKTLSFDISTGNAAAWNARMCVYADTGAGSPGALVPGGDTGTVAIGSGSVVGVQTANVNGATSVQLGGPAWYWLAFMADNVAVSVFSTGGGGQSISRVMGAPTALGLFTANISFGVSGAQTFSACPASFPSPTIGAASQIYLAAGF